jgi:cytochrome d ubiquinol oxidase subunit I
LRRNNEVAVFASSAKIGLIVGFVAASLTAAVGHIQGEVMTQVQPMKMAAAEALWDTTKGADFSLFAIGDVSEGRNKVNLAIPHGLSILADNNPNSTVEGINDVNAEEAAKYGSGDYKPIVPITYWTFRWMVGIGFATAGFCALGLFLLYRKKLTTSRWFLWLAIPVMVLPFVGNSLGWIFTEMGRQPWVVYGLLRTRDAVSPTVGVGSIVTTLVIFTLLYGTLAVVEFRLLAKYAKLGPPTLEPHEVDPELPRTPGLVY